MRTLKPATDDLIEVLMKNMIQILVREPDGQSLIEESLICALSAIEDNPIVRLEGSTHTLH